MKRFRSRVSPLRELRQRQEDEALQAHARMLRQRQAAEERLQATLDALKDHLREVQESLRFGCSASQLAQQDGYRALLEHRSEECQRQVAAAAAAAAASLQEVMRTRRNREVVDRFCAKELAEHALEQQREDQKNLDEMALRRRPAIASTPTRHAFP
jgi:flagellar export protein FliJ